MKRRLMVGSPCLVVVALSVLLSGCGGAQRSTRLADGSWKVECFDQIERCVHQAARVCGNEDYEIVGGGGKRSVYGGATGVQTATERHVLVVHCGRDGGEFSEPAVEEKPKSTKSGAKSHADAEKQASQAPSPPAQGPAPARVCAPGSTQRCFGAGACEGGQSCKADGSGYSPCDCGGGSAPPPTREPPDGDVSAP